MQVSYSKLQLHSTVRSHPILLIRARITLLSLLMMRCELHGDRYDALDHIQHHRSLLFLFFVIKHFPQISYFQVKSAVMRAETELDKTYVSLTQNDWATMEKIKLFLKPFAELTTKASSEHACISQVIPFVKVLLFKLDRLPSRGVCRLKQELIAETKRYFRGRDSRDHFPDIETDDLFSQATLLDPRFKKNGFSSTSSADEAFETLVKYAEEIVLNQSSSSVTQVLVDPAPADDDDWAQCLGSQHSENDDDPEISIRDPTVCRREAESYIAEKVISRTDSPFTYWAVNRKKFPRLATLARRFLSAPMGSVASEREFKIAKRVTTNRGTLKPGNVEKLLFMKYNLRLMNYNY